MCYGITIRMYMLANENLETRMAIDNIGLGGVGGGFMFMKKCWRNQGKSRFQVAEVNEQL